MNLCRRGPLPRCAVVEPRDPARRAVFHVHGPPPAAGFFFEEERGEP